MRHREPDPTVGGLPPHTVYQDRRVFTDARGSFYDASTGGSRTCTCNLAHDHREVIERVAFVPDDD